MSGYVYCMSSSSHYDVERQQQLYKIGKTNSPWKRLREMNRKSTHVPSPFVLHFAKYVQNVDRMEKKLHEYFAEVRYNPNREYFAVHIDEIKRIFDFIDGLWFAIENPSCEIETVEVEEHADAEAEADAEDDGDSSCAVIEEEDEEELDVAPRCPFFQVSHGYHLRIHKKRRMDDYV